MEGINHSVLFMLVMVFFIVGGFAFLVWNSYRTAERRIARLEAAGDPPREA
jgi:hypothetical protein